MELTKHDVLFLEAVNSASQNKKALIASRAVISPQLLKMFDIGANAPGGWFFDVHVEFEPLFKEKAPEEWQKEREI